MTEAAASAEKGGGPADGPRPGHAWPSAVALVAGGDGPTRSAVAAAAGQILTLLLNRYERSETVFNKPGPWTWWPRATWSAKDFPAAFAPDGREVSEALLAGVSALDRAGAIEVVYETRRTHHRRPTAFVLRPHHVECAYAIAGPLVGYVRADRALGTFAHDVQALIDGLPPSAPSWLRAALSDVVAGAHAGEPRRLLVTRKHLRANVANVTDALAAVSEIACGVDRWEREISSALFNDSKRLGKIRNYVCRLLVAWDPAWRANRLDYVTGSETAVDDTRIDTGDTDLSGDAARDGSEALLESYGVRFRPAQATVSGPFSVDFDTGGERVAASLRSLTDWPAHLLAPLAQALATLPAPPRVVTTVENQTSFWSYLERGAADDELVVYTGGFPNPSTTRFLQAFLQASPGLPVRHWGDADAGGVAIWWMLRQRLGCPVSLYRTTAAWLTECVDRNATSPLTASDRQRMLLSHRRLVPLADAPTHPDVAEVVRLLDVMIERRAKAEQEAFS